jgi:hypothetical protein
LENGNYFRLEAWVAETAALRKAAPSLPPRLSVALGKRSRPRTPPRFPQPPLRCHHGEDNPLRTQERARVPSRFSRKIAPSSFHFQIAQTRNHRGARSPQCARLRRPRNSRALHGPNTRKNQERGVRHLAILRQTGRNNLSTPFRLCGLHGVVNLTRRTSDLAFFVVPTFLVHSWLTERFTLWLNTGGKNGRQHSPTNRKRHLSYKSHAEELESFRDA